LTSAHQNDLKTPKNINLKQRKNKKISNFFKSLFKMQKQIGLISKIIFLKIKKNIILIYF
jgi:hypothetical protein